MQDVGIIPANASNAEVTPQARDCVYQCLAPQVHGEVAGAFACIGAVISFHTTWQCRASLQVYFEQAQKACSLSATELDTAYPGTVLSPFAVISA